MKMFFKTVFVLILLCSLGLAANAKNGYCDIAGIFIEVGTEAPHPTECWKIVCINEDTISGIGCPAFIPRPGCRLSAIDNSKRYPDCCPKHVCD